MNKVFSLMLLSLCSVPLVFGQQLAPDFKLMDVGIASPRLNTVVSPRDYTFQISAYYFGDAG